ncbi:Selenophosphate synthase, related [Neospora caninum Liverpool]|uniref:Selenophosphate synthase, related n=1 Tax=Neospora caninum (strain Liverpool) TaxID=572307 RepID=F0VEM6_NEOCL|nr:Selenophosphate synthase, related [Neospora caninum Liverpool]CBZ52170.1 Selenophosphate synthase, related [Neospora caninum Liverpool]CEL66136.1 TPA: Selenophosphate synthase, related [Neospora caninum Liverpool]|eukprot:XP_003882202.1 Selenophosphate synthase, related [Neospora caninum Liverpool]
MGQTGKGGCSMQGLGSIARDIVLVGGGPSHLYLLKEWAREPEKGVRLTLISAETDSPCRRLLPGLLAGVYTRDQSHVDLLQLCQVSRGRFVRASVLGVDREKKLLFCDDGRPPLRYDVLSIDTESGLSVPASITFSAPSAAREAESSPSVSASPAEGTSLGELEAAQVASLDVGDQCMRACITPLRPLSQFYSRWEAALQRLANAALRVWARSAFVPGAAEAHACAQADGAAPAEKANAKLAGRAEDGVPEVFSVAVVGGGRDSVEICFAVKAAVEKKLAELRAHWRTLRREGRATKDNETAPRQRDAQPQEAEAARGQKRESEDLGRLFRVEFHIFTETASVLPRACSGTQTRVSRLLKASGIVVHPHWNVASVHVETAPPRSSFEASKDSSGLAGGSPLAAAAVEAAQEGKGAERAAACAEFARRETSVRDATCGSDGRGETESEAASCRKRLVGADGRHFEFDECVWCTPATPQPWFQNAGLELTSNGFLAVDAFLRSLNTPNVFAVGDVAQVVGTPSPMDGDHAGEPLSKNLRLFLRNGDGARLHRWHPVARLLSFVSCGMDYAVGTKGHLSFEGTWVSKLKTRMDINWIQKYQVLPSGLTCPSLLSRKAPTPSASPASPHADSAHGDVTRSSSAALVAPELAAGERKRGFCESLFKRKEDEELSLGCRVLMGYVQGRAGGRDKKGGASGCQNGGGTRCGGCGAKVPSTVLRRTMQELEQANDLEASQHRLLCQQRDASRARATRNSVEKGSASDGGAPARATKQLAAEAASRAATAGSGAPALQLAEALQLAALQKRIDKEGRFYPLLFNREEVLVGLEDADDGCIFAARPLASLTPRDAEKEAESDDGRPTGRMTTFAEDPCDAPGDDNPLLVQTVDFYRAFFDDAYVLGRIAATHAMSDCYAMGAEPLVALLTAVVPYSTDCIMANNLLQLLGGCCSALSRDRCQLAGGHSAQGREMAAGLTVTGRLSRLRRSERNGQTRSEGEAAEGNHRAPAGNLPIGYLPKGSAEAQEGDVLILTKPLGTGVIMAGHVEGKSRGRWVYGALDLMQVSNRAAAEILMDCGATACTDVTGFGLLGHLLEMLRACRKSRIMAAVAGAEKTTLDTTSSDAEGSSCASSGGTADSSSGDFLPLVCARVLLPSLRLLDGAMTLMDQGIHSSLLASNARFFSALSLKTVGATPAAAEATGDLPVQPLSPSDLPPKLPILFDPQTSGGLLAFVPASKADECIKRLREEGGYDNAVVIGSVFERKTFVPFPQKDASQGTRPRYAPWENVSGVVECLY